MYEESSEVPGPYYNRPNPTFYSNLGLGTRYS